MSEIAIVFSYLAYAVLYMKVIQLKREGIVKKCIVRVYCSSIWNNGIISDFDWNFSIPTLCTILLDFFLSVCIAGYFLLLPEKSYRYIK